VYNFATSDIDVRIGDIDISKNDIDIMLGDIDVSVNDIDISVNDIDISVNDIDINENDIDISENDNDIMSGDIDVSVNNADISAGDIIDRTKGERFASCFIGTKEDWNNSGDKDRRRRESCRARQGFDSGRHTGRGGDLQNRGG